MRPNLESYATPAQMDVRMVTLLLGDLSNRIRKSKRLPKVLKFERLFQMVLIDGMPTGRKLLQKRGDLFRAHRRHAASTRNAGLLGELRHVKKVRGAKGKCLCALKSRRMREAVLVARAGSRYGAVDLSRTAQLLTRRGIRIEQTHIVPSHEALHARVKDAVRSRAEIVVVCGGDGSQSAAVDAMAQSESVLGIIPAGTGNSFARSLSIKPSLEDAVDVIASAKVVRIDLPRANKTYFANFATVGLAAQIAVDTPHLLKRTTGPLAYVLTGVAPVLFHRPFHCTVKWDGKKSFEMTTDQIIVGRYFGAEPILSDVTPFDGRLAFFATRAGGTWSTLRSYLALLRGTERQLSDAHCFSAEKIKIRTDSPQPLSLDGSDFGETPVKFSVCRRALRVFVPQTLANSA